MVFSAEDRILIKCLREQKGYGAKRLILEFPNKNWSLGGLKSLLNKIDTYRSIERRSGSGRPKTARTEHNIAAVEELILSQEDKPQTHRTQRQIVRDTGISRTSVQRIIKNDLRLKCFKKKRVQELTDANKLTRMVRARQLLKKYSATVVNFIWFTDEKVFTVARPSNSQNDRLYAAVGSTKNQLPAARLLRTRSHFSQSVMVSVGVSVLGSTSLHFVEPGVKVNAEYYRNILLQELLPEIRELSGNEFFTFQQDSAPAHRARDTILLLERETPDLILQI